MVLKPLKIRPPAPCIAGILNSGKQIPIAFHLGPLLYAVPYTMVHLLENDHHRLCFEKLIRRQIKNDLSI